MPEGSIGKLPQFNPATVTTGPDKPVSPYGRARSGANPPPRLNGPSPSGNDQGIAQKPVKSGPPPEPRAQGGTPPLATKFGDLSTFLAGRFSKPMGKQDHKWQLTFLAHFKSVMQQPGAFAHEGVPLNKPDQMVDHLIKQAVDSAPADKKSLVRDQLSSPVMREELKTIYETAQGDLRQKLVGQNQGAKFERTMDPNSFTVEQLPAALKSSKEFKAFMHEAQSALSKGGQKGAEAFEKLGPKLNTILQGKDAKGEPYLSKSEQLALTLSDGHAFTHSLLQQIQKDTSFLHASSVESSAKELLKGDGCEKFHHQVAVGLGGKMSNDLATMELDGKTYHQVKALGQGNFGTVYLFKQNPNDPTETGLVVKRPVGKMDPTWASKVTDPASEARSLVTALGTGASQTNTEARLTPITTVIRTEHEVLVVMPRAELGGYVDALKTGIDSGKHTPEEKALMRLTPFTDVLEGVERLQQATGQVHKDIAARNILITGKGTGQLADFGLTQSLDQKENSSRETGVTQRQDDKPISVRWSPPELLNGGEIGPKSDTWMLGVTLLEVAKEGALPFGHLPNREFLDHIGTLDAQNPTPTLPELDTAMWPNGTAQKLTSLISSMLQVDPAKRPSLDEVRRQLQKDFPGVGSPETRKMLVDVLTMAKERSSTRQGPADDNYELAQNTENLQDEEKTYGWTQNSVRPTDQAEEKYYQTGKDLLPSESKAEGVSTNSVPDRVSPPDPNPILRTPVPNKNPNYGLTN